MFPYLSMYLECVIQGSGTFGQYYVLTLWREYHDVVVVFKQQAYLVDEVRACRVVRHLLEDVLEILQPHQQILAGLIGSASES